MRSSLAPSLLRLWQQDLQLDGRKASALLGSAWKPYADTVRDCARTAS